MENQEYNQNQQHGPQQLPPPPPAGGPPPPDYTARRRSLPYKTPFLAGLLSGLLPGLGQVYVGYYQFGFTLAAIFAGCITFLSLGMGGLEPFFGLTLAFVWFYGIIDAVRRAGAYNRVLDGLAPDQDLPELTMPGWKGSRAGGIVLIVLGGLIFLETTFDINLQWLENVWPLGLVGLGAWLLYKSRREQDTVASEKGDHPGA